MSDCTGQKVVILAGRSTIGQSVARRLTGAGAGVALLARNLEDVDTGEVAFSAQCDLTDFASVEEAVETAKERMNGLTGILSCAGSMILKPAHLTSRQDFDDAIAANLLTAFAAVRAAGKHLARSGGSVVLVSSAAASLGMPNHELIGAAKAGIEGLTRSAAATYASRGTRFNAVAPGLTATRMTEKLVSSDGTRKISESLHPLGRIGEPDDVARAICWLLDPAQSWVTGQVIGVDGGLGRVQPKPKIFAPA